MVGYRHCRKTATFLDRRDRCQNGPRKESLPPYQNQSHTQDSAYMTQSTLMVDLAVSVVRTPSLALDMTHLGLVEIETWTRSDSGLRLRCRAVGEVGVLVHKYSKESWLGQWVFEVCWLRR